MAERVLQGLWTSENIAQKAVILVANKADLARSRVVTSEGKSNNLRLYGNNKRQSFRFIYWIGILEEIVALNQLVVGIPTVPITI